MNIPPEPSAPPAASVLNPDEYETVAGGDLYPTVAGGGSDATAADGGEDGGAVEVQSTALIQNTFLVRRS